MDETTTTTIQTPPPPTPAEANGSSGGAPHGSTVHPIARVGAPRGSEATTEEFRVWVDEDEFLEKTQLVTVESTAGRANVELYGLVTEVHRLSRSADMLEEADRFDGDPNRTVPLESGGVTFADVRVLGAFPNLLVPPKEESLVRPAGAAAASAAYGMASMATPITLGLVRNGGMATAGPAKIDGEYLLGGLGGHLNVTGIAGVGTKSSFLTVVTAQLLRRFADERARRPAEADLPRARCVILNVKALDLFWLDHWSTGFTEEDRAAWAEMGVPDPMPLDAMFYAPQAPTGTLALPTGRAAGEVYPYSWSLADVVTGDLFGLLFADSDRDDDLFALMLSDVERLLVDEFVDANGETRRRLKNAAIATTFQELLGWFDNGLDENTPPPPNWDRFERNHHPGTVKRFYRRLRRIVFEASGILRLDGAGSNPLDVTALPEDRPIVVDLSLLKDAHLQRFVVAALFKQAAEDQTGPRARPNMHYLFVLDELNRFAPKGASDPITKLIEHVAAELRSRGVILLGAQQQASLVSTRVVENASIRVLGRTGGHELRSDVHSFLPAELRTFVETMEGGDKVVNAPSFRQPMLVRVPRPPWAMRRAEATKTPPACLPGAAAVADPAPRRLPARPYEEH